MRVTSTLALACALVAVLTLAACDSGGAPKEAEPSFEPIELVPLESRSLSLIDRMSLDPAASWAFSASPQGPLEATVHSGDSLRLRASDLGMGHVHVVAKSARMTRSALIPVQVLEEAIELHVLSEVEMNLLDSVSISLDSALYHAPNRVRPTFEAGADGTVRTSIRQGRLWIVALSLPGAATVSVTARGAKASSTVQVRVRVRPEVITLLPQRTRSAVIGDTVHVPLDSIFQYTGPRPPQLTPFSNSTATVFIAGAFLHIVPASTTSFGVLRIDGLHSSAQALIQVNATFPKLFDASGCLRTPPGIVDLLPYRTGDVVRFAAWRVSSPGYAYPEAEPVDSSRWEYTWTFRDVSCQNGVTTYVMDERSTGTTWKTLGGVVVSTLPFDVSTTMTLTAEAELRFRSIITTATSATNTRYLSCPVGRTLCSGGGGYGAGYRSWEAWYTGSPARGLETYRYKTADQRARRQWEELTLRRLP